MKKIILSFALLFSCASAASADNLANARELVAMWQPNEVTISDQKLIIVLPQQRITDTIYLAVITSGLCLGELFGKEVSGISEIQILNQFSAQGYVYEKGLEDCRKFNRTPAGGDSTKFRILAETHMFQR